MPLLLIVAIVLGASTPDSDAAFRQGNDFYYLTGVEAPDARLVIDGQRKESILFLTMDEKAADGLGLPVELARSPTAYTGIERSLPADGLGGFLSGLYRPVNRS